MDHSPEVSQRMMLKFYMMLHWTNVFYSCSSLRTKCPIRSLSSTGASESDTWLAKMIAAPKDKSCMMQLWKLKILIECIKNCYSYGDCLHLSLKGLLPWCSEGPLSILSVITETSITFTFVVELGTVTSMIVVTEFQRFPTTLPMHRVPLN